MTISTVEQLREVLCKSSHVITHDGFDQFWPIPPPPSANRIRVAVGNELGVERADQIAVVPAHLTLDQLDDELAGADCALPHGARFAPDPWHGDGSWTMREALDLNLPHRLEGAWGTWRHWVLGMSMMLADGAVVKAGAKVVKSVAGYDLHKLMIGGRGTLGIVLDVTVRIVPRGSIAIMPSITFPDSPIWCQRVLPSDFSTALERAPGLLSQDPATHTLWGQVNPGMELERYPHDWVVKSGCDQENIRIDCQTAVATMKKAKSIFDPESKLNPGAFGFV